MNPNIFRAYDIRGVYPTELDESTAYAIGRAYIEFLKKKYSLSHPKIIVGRDNRPHGESLLLKFIEGAQHQGAVVDRLEDSPSPMLYFAVCKGDYDGGVNITASHNPAEYNGFKLQGRQAHSIAGEDIQTIKNMILEDDFLNEAPQLENTVEGKSFSEQYYQKISSIVSINRPLKIVLDAGNGITGKYYPELFRKLGCEVIELYCEQDGTFPNHQPDPVEESTTADLKKKVLEENADLGIAFDGDGDRCGIIDETGTYHDANESMVLLLEDALKRHPQSTIVYTVSNSLIVPQKIKEQGGNAVMVPVGHSHVEQAMSEHNAIFGGEQSGHFFLSEQYFSYDDAAYAAARLCSIIADDESCSKAYANIPKTHTHPEFRIDCDDVKKFSVVEDISKKLASQYSANTLDGVRVEFDNDAWLGIRASNTSPKLSVIMEATTAEQLKEIEEIAEATLREHGLSLY